MQVTQFKKVNRLLFTSFFVLVAFSLWQGMPFIAFLGIGAYMVVISLLKTRVKGILADERQIKVAERAAQTSFQVILPMLLLASVALITSGGSQEFYYVRALGIILSYVTSLVLVIYLLTYWYFDKKSGGR